MRVQRSSDVKNNYMKTLRTLMIVLHSLRGKLYMPRRCGQTQLITAFWWSGHLIDTKKMVQNCDVCSKSFSRGTHYSIALLMGTSREISTNIISHNKGGGGGNHGGFVSKRALPQGKRKLVILIKFLEMYSKQRKVVVFVVIYDLGA